MMNDAEKEIVKQMLDHPDVNPAVIMIEIAKMRMNMELADTGSESVLIRLPWEEKGRTISMLINLE